MRKTGLMGLVLLSLGLFVAGTWRVNRPVVFASVALLLGAHYLAARPSLVRLRRPGVWLWPAGILLLAGMLGTPRDFTVLGIPLSSQGLLAGIDMVGRALFLVGLGLVLSRALGGRLRQHQRLHQGFPGFRMALATAARTVPELGAELRRSLPSLSRSSRRAHWKGFDHLVKSMLSRSIDLAEEMAEGDWGSPDCSREVIALVCPQGGGKTWRMTQLADALTNAGAPPGGVLQPALWKDDRKVAYDLILLPEGQRIPLAHRNNHGPGFQFVSGAFDQAATQILRSASEDRAVLVDEMGLLESEGKGHLPAVRKALFVPGKSPFILAIRAGCQEAIQAGLGVTLQTLTAQEWDPQSLVDRILPNRETTSAPALEFKGPEQTPTRL